MSLIEEALRRAKDPMLHSSIKEAAKQGGAAVDLSEESPAPGHTHWKSAFFNLCLMAAASVTVATVVLVGVTWFSGQARLHPLSLEPAESPTVIAKTQSSRAVKRSFFPKLIQMQDAQEAFVISGVVEGSGPSFAVINGKVLTVGESINGATLLAIQNNTVRLRTAGGDEIALAVPR